MMPDAHGDLSAFIAHVRRRWLTCVRLRALGLASLWSSIPIVLAVLLDRRLHPEGRPLVALAVLTGCAAISMAAYVLRRMHAPPDDRRVARFIEERAALNPTIDPLEDAVVTAVSVAPGTPASFGPLLAAAANRKLAGLTPALIVPVSALRRSGGLAAAGVLVLGGVIWLAVPPLTAAVETAWLLWSPGSIRIDVLPGHVRVPVGSPMNIRAVVRVGSRVLTRFQPSVVVSGGDEVRALPMAAQNGSFELAVTSVDQTFRYRVAAGPHTSPEFMVTALVPPQVRRVDARYEYPSFTGLPPRDVEDSGDLYAPAGTRVRLRVHTSGPVTSGVMALSKGTPDLPLRRSGQTLLEGDILLTRDDGYRLRLTDADGLRGGMETEYFIRLMDDRPPEVRIVRPGGDEPITPLQELTIEARADDDHGVASLALSYSVSGRPERTIPFSRLSGTNVAKNGAYLLSAEELRVQPGDVIAYYARARDIGRGKRSSEVRTDMFFLEVRPFNEEFVRADSQAGSASGDPQLDSLIAAQKDIISATWRIERRSGDGRSAADVKSVSQAQRELQARAQQMTRGSRATSAFQLPQQVGQFGQRRMRTAGAEAMASAVQAMGEAVQRLEGQKTNEALPHEMAALRGLLQAQAEVRRRQVAQQARGASGNGYGRQGQDLSALFDKELQRQQRTNYETRPSTSERRGETLENTALDRIRDLARRQEELNARQRELARTQSPPEERKRRLQELTREQEALRERAENVRRQLDDRGGSAGAGAREMREAAGQMRSAAAELQRDDPSAAAARSTRAVEQLRAVEEGLRRGLPAGGERAAGDLRLEGQQIVEAQRRIAEETARLDPADAAQSSVRERLSAEKNTLANRVDALERAARAQAQGGSRGADGPRRAAAEAAAELKRQRIGERMRSSARAMQSGKGTGRERAEADREITRALDSAVAHFGTGLSADARSLSQQLDESRGMRERLDRLAERVRELDAQARAQPRGSRASGSGGRGSAGAGSGPGDASTQLRQEYAEELARARAALDRLTGAQPRGGGGGATPEEQVFSRSSPGNETFKQDYTDWESLRKGVHLGIEQYEASVSRQLAKQLAADRLSAGGSERGPDAYASLIARYYESLARTKR